MGVRFPPGVRMQKRIGKYALTPKKIVRVEEIEDGVTKKERQIYDIVRYLLDGNELLNMDDMIDGLRHIRRLVIPTSKIADCEDCDYDND